MAYVPNGKPRGRPRIPRPGEPGYIAPSEVLSGEPAIVPEGAKEIRKSPSILRAPKQFTKKKTLEEFANEMDSWRAKYAAAVESGSKEIPNLRSAIELVEKEAKLYGYSMASLVDRRAESDKINEAVEKLFIHSGEKPSLLEMMDAEIEAVEGGIKAAVQQCQWAEDDSVKQEIGKEELANRERARMKLRMGKEWLARLARLRALKELAREPVPAKCRWMPLMDRNPRTRGSIANILDMGYEARKEVREQMEARFEHVLMASLPLRHMAYVMRTNLSDRQMKGSATAIFDLKKHHAQAAWELYLMENDLDWTADGLVKCEPWEGAIIVMPPGLGKTTVGVAFFGMKTGQNRHNKILMGHAIETLAVKNHRYLSSMFKDDNAAGRRMAALYGKFEFDKDSDHEFRLVMDDRSKQSTLTAHGVSAKISGSDADYVWMDDPVDISEREQPEERRRKLETMNGTWFTRLRGKKSKHVTTTTLWHEDDANCKRIRMAREGKLRIRVLVLRHGGPDDKPMFWSLWPEEFPPSKLRGLYEGDAANYSACYLSDPRIEQLRVIRKLRFYDPSAPEHRDFMQGAVMHLSADPAATSRAKSDKAGLLYCACGQVSSQPDADGMTKHETRLRIIEAREFHATQSALVNEIGRFANTTKVDYVHIEMVNGFAATGEMLMNQFGVDAISHHPGIKSKEIRLKGVATLIDNSMKGNVHGGAVVEFPGIVDRFGRVGPDPAYQWLYEQFLRFGMVKADHCVDALTQLVGHLQRTGELNAGAGFVTQMVQQAVADGSTDQRLKRMLDAVAGGLTKKSVEEEDAEFLEGDSLWN